MEVTPLDQPAKLPVPILLPDLLLLNGLNMIADFIGCAQFQLISM